MPIIFLSAVEAISERVAGLDLGADDYLPKPFNPRELLARVRAVLRRSEPEDDDAASAAVRVGELVVNPAARRVEMGGREIELTTAEFDILRALAEAAGRVLSRGARRATSPAATPTSSAPRPASTVC